MDRSEPSLASRRALVPAGRPVVDPVAEAQAEVAALLAQVGALDAEVEALSSALAGFAVEVERRLGPADAALARAAGLVRRLRTLTEGLEQERAAVAARRGMGSQAPGARRAAGHPAGRGAGGTSRRSADREAADQVEGADWEGAGDRAGEVGAESGAEVEPTVEVPTAERLAAELKQLYRRLARLLHPDLAQTDDERHRLGDLMARVNAAWAAQDRTALELMAEKVGAGEPPGELTVEERQAHLARRREQLARVASSLTRERDRLARSETARLWREAAARRAEGRELLAEEAAALQAEAEAAGSDALARLDALAASAARLGRERRGAMGELTKKQGGAVARRAFDPLAESALVRRSAARLDLSRAGAPARALARWMEEAATRTPWEAGLTVLAFLLEAAGDRPPPAVAKASGLAERWALLRDNWAGAPPLAEALARAPRHLVVGARLGAEEVLAGPQLAEAGLSAGVRLALEHGAVAALARQVLAALGPEERCGGCRKPVLGLHLLRTRGLDERHGIACPRCGKVLRSYWRYGEAEGLEALAPVSLALGLVVEQPLSLGGASLGFQLLPAEREALTARELLARFAELYLEPYEAPVKVAALRLVQGAGAKAKPLGPATRVGGLRGLSLRLLPETGLAEVGLLELLRTRIERRFRPGG
jgi:hypothetical protein